MSSLMENNNFEMELLDLQKQLGEEKRAHGETILRYLSAQAQAQTAESEAAKAQELVTETTLKLDQAREEIRSLRDQAQEAKAKIDGMEAQMAQIKVYEQSQTAIEAQAQELKTAQAKIANLEALVAKARAVFLESEVTTIPEPRDQAEEFKAKIKDLEAQMAQMKVVEQFQAQTQELKAAQAKIKDLEAFDTQEEVQSLRAQVQKLEKSYARAQEFQDQVLQEAQAMIENLEAQVPRPPVQACMLSEWYALSRQSTDQWFCIVQNGLRLYFEGPVANSHLFCKFVPNETVILELAGPELKLKTWFRVSLMDEKSWKTIGHLGPENNKILIGQLLWRVMLGRVPFRINSDGKHEYKLAICCEALPNNPTISSS